MKRSMPKCAHDGQAILGHGALGVGLVLGIARRRGAGAVAAQVGEHQRDVARKLGRDLVPAHVGLRVAVQQQQRRTGAAGAHEDLGAVRLDAMLGEAGKEVGDARSWACPLARHGPPADVGAVEAARPIDGAYGLVGARLRLGDRLAARRDAEHAPAGGEQPVALAARAGMEDLDARNACAPPPGRGSPCPWRSRRDSPWRP